MIESVRIESDERGFVLELTGDFEYELENYMGAANGLLRLRLPQDAALALLAAARSEIGPWAAEGESERRAYDRATDEEREQVLYGVAADEADDYLDTADLERKRQREAG